MKIKLKIVDLTDTKVISVLVLDIRNHKLIDTLYSYCKENNYRLCLDLDYSKIDSIEGYLDLISKYRNLKNKIDYCISSNLYPSIQSVESVVIRFKSIDEEFKENYAKVKNSTLSKNQIDILLEYLDLPFIIKI